MTGTPRNLVTPFAREPAALKPHGTFRSPSRLFQICMYKQWVESIDSGPVAPDCGSVLKLVVALLMVYIYAIYSIHNAFPLT